MTHIRAHHNQIKWLAILPTDAPLLPQGLVDDMMRAAQAQSVSLVSVMSKGRTHPVIGLWSLAVFDALEAALVGKGPRKIDAFTGQIGCHYISYDEGDDPFVNLNRPDDLAAYRARIEG